MVNTAFRIVACICVFIVISSVNATSWITQGVTGNLVLDNNRLIFSQSQGGMTCLDTKSGACIHRNANREYGKDLVIINDYLIAWSYDSIKGMDKNSLAIRWKNSVRNDSVEANSEVIVYKDIHGLHRISEVNGEILWSLNERDISHFRLFNNRIAVTIDHGSHNQWNPSSEEDSTTRPVSLLILDAKIGSKIWEDKLATRKSHLEMVTSKDEINFRYNINPEKGVAEIEQSFNWDGDLLSTETVRPYQPDSYTKIDQSDSYYVTNLRGGPIFPSHIRLASADLTVDVSTLDADTCKGIQIIKYSSDNGTSWTGLLPYIDGTRFYISSILQHENLLYIGTTKGQVECVDTSTGKSRWKYTFPIFMPPTTKKAYALYDFAVSEIERLNQLNKSNRTTGGMITVPEIISTDANSVVLRTTEVRILLPPPPLKSSSRPALSS